MKERQRLETAITGIRALEQGLQDNVELIAMGEEEGDAEVVTEAENAIRALEKDVAERQIETLLSGEAMATTPMWKSTRAPAARRARTGRRCSCACTCAGASGPR